MAAAADMKTMGAVGAEALAAFVVSVRDHGRELYRDLPWRDSRDPYAVLVSEVMLQQTQVARVLPLWERWLDRFESFEALAASPLPPVLEAWQGLGYNRRAVALKRAAEEVVLRFAGTCPSDEAQLRSLPGIGPATAAGVRAFAFDLPSAYLETNVRTVFLHELFADADAVPDREIVPLVEAAMRLATEAGASAREWNFALLDYGAHLKRTMPNPSRRSAHHTRQSAFEGSRRQKRARLLRAVMALPGHPAEQYAAVLEEAETRADRAAPDPDEVMGLLGELEREGFLTQADGVWSVA